MTTPTSAQTASLRDLARRPDGRFGVQPRRENDVTILEDPAPAESEPGVLARALTADQAAAIHEDFTFSLGEFMASSDQHKGTFVGNLDYGRAISYSQAIAAFDETVPLDRIDTAGGTLRAIQSTTRTYPDTRLDLDAISAERVEAVSRELFRRAMYASRNGAAEVGGATVFRGMYTGQTDAALTCVATLLSPAAEDVEQRNTRISHAATVLMWWTSRPSCFDQDPDDPEILDRYFTEAFGPASS